jgi:hypothetical protein
MGHLRSLLRPAVPPRAVDLVPPASCLLGPPGSKHPRACSAQSCGPRRLRESFRGSKPKADLKHPAAPRLTSEPFLANHRKQAAYPAVLRVLEGELQRPAYAQAARQLAAVVDPRRSSVFDEMIF